MVDIAQGTNVLHIAALAGELCVTSAVATRASHVALESVHRDRASDSLVLLELLLAAIGGQEERGIASTELRQIALTGICDVSTQKLTVAADWAALDKGIDASRELERIAESSRDPAARSDARFRAGNLLAAPFMAIESVAAYPALAHQWRNRAADDLVFKRLLATGQRGKLPHEFLAESERHLRAALGNYGWASEAQCAGILVSVLRWREALGVISTGKHHDVDPDELERLCHRAIGDGLTTEYSLSVSICGVLQAIGRAYPARILDRVITADPEELYRSVGPTALGSVISNVITILIPEPDRAFEVLQRFYPAIERLETRAREDVLRSMGHLFWLEPILNVVNSELDEPSKFEAYARATPLGSLERVRRLAASADRWACEGVVRNDLLREARASDPEFASAHNELFRILDGVVHADAGAALATRPERRTKALQHLGKSAAMFAELGLGNALLESLDHVAKLCEQATQSEAKIVLNTLAPHALAIAIAAEPASSTRLQELWYLLLSRFGFGNPSWLRVRLHSISGRSPRPRMLDGASIFTLQQLVNGFRYAALLEGDSGISVAEVPEAAENLTLLTEMQALGAVADPHVAHLDRELELVVPVDDTQKPGPARPAREVQENLERSFDRMLQIAFLRRSGEPRLATIDEIASSLPDDALIWSMARALYHPPLNSTIWSTLVSSEGSIAIEQQAQPLLRGGLDIEGYRLTGLEALVFGARLEISKVRPGLGSGETAQTNFLTDVFGPVAKALLDYASAGYKRLVIIPDGPLHFFPFHLMNLGDGLLADHFLTTIAPSVRHAVPTLVHPDRGGRAVSSFGMSFSSGEGQYSALPGANSESTTVASAFGESCFQDNEATKERVLAALSRDRRVHIATHGSHHPSAPAFQSIVLSDGGGGLVRLFAYEVLSLDLRGLEVVSLGACETGLGRVDLFGNLRGITSSLLARGVRCVIAALWPVSDAAAELFFGTFYRELAAGTDAPQAFQAAQFLTRTQFPALRDWAPFVYIGSALGPVGAEKSSSTS